MRPGFLRRACIGAAIGAAACRSPDGTNPLADGAVDARRPFDSELTDATTLPADQRAAAEKKATDADGGAVAERGPPDGGLAAADEVRVDGTARAEPTTRRGCPADMVDVAGRLCVDRYEDTMVDDPTGRRLSPHYPPEPRAALRVWTIWQDRRLAMGPEAARRLELPPLPEIQRLEDFRPRAASIRGVLPQGYVSGVVAAEACARAHKRLCTRQEWIFACRGERQTKYPYGDEYRAGACNVFRSAHPAAILHDDASAGHSDPRLGLVQGADGPLLRPTGATKSCASRWGKDAIFDMVGNEDEWIDDPEGTFVGGFFSRSTKEGCDSVVTVHPITHWDYSIGLRCCR